MPPLHLAIAVLCRTTGGPATYGKALVHALAERDDVRLTVVTDDATAFASLPPSIERVHLPMRGGLDRLRWQYVALPRALRAVRPAVYHDTKNALPFGLRMPAVVTVHDLAYHTVPGSFGFWSRMFLRRATADAVLRAAAIVVPSQATANDLRRCHPRCGERLHVVPHGIHPAPTLAPTTLAAARTRLGLPENFVLHVGTVQARKNIHLVVDGVRLLRQRGLPHRAVIVGRVGWLAKQALRSIRQDDTALWIEHLNPTDLAAVYALADAFVSPSAYEGFGFAVADALAAGVSTVISDISSLPELCGDAAIRLPALTAEAVATALAGLFADPTQAAALRRRGIARARSLDWQQAAAGHMQAYRAALPR